MDDLELEESRLLLRETNVKRRPKKYVQFDANSEEKNTEKSCVNNECESNY